MMEKSRVKPKKCCMEYHLQCLKDELVELEIEEQKAQIALARAEERVKILTEVLEELEKIELGESNSLLFRKFDL